MRRIIPFHKLYIIQLLLLFYRHDNELVLNAIVLFYEINLT